MKSIINNDKECYKCHTTINLHKHHIFKGINRKKADQDGCWVYLCGRHHNQSNEGVHFNKELDLTLKKKEKKRWLKKKKKTIEEFIKRYGRNYL